MKQALRGTGFFQFYGSDVIGNRALFFKAERFRGKTGENRQMV